MERLQKVMAHAGIASRRKSEDIISQGRVKVNGQTVTEMGTKVDPDSDIIEVDGEVISEEKKVYILLNKPRGYVTTVDDPHNRKTVLDLLKDINQRIYPVGRLDYDISGLLLLTNDGELTHVLTHPSFEIDKTYRVVVEGKMEKKDFQHLENGVDIGEVVTSTAQVKFLQYEGGVTKFNITIHEGRNRQVRRMCRSVGYEVKKLSRISLGPLTLENLSRGDYRFLNSSEIEELKSLKTI